MRIRRRPHSLLSSSDLAFSSHQLNATNYTTNGLESLHEQAQSKGDIEGHSTHLTKDHQYMINYVNKIGKEEEVKIEIEDAKGVVNQVNDDDKRNNGISPTLGSSSAEPQQSSNVGGLEHNNSPLVSVDSRRSKSRSTRKGNASGTSIASHSHNNNNNGNCNDKNIDGTALEKLGLKVNTTGGSNNGTGTTTKKRKSPSVLMEGSRCSRVNGRGWRCCQQTLVGYSLCEHHLGKGRLRSMSSVKGQLGTSKANKVDNEDAVDKFTTSPHRHHEKEQNASSGNVGEEEEGNARRKKMSMAKARSISSLFESQLVKIAPGESEAML